MKKTERLSASGNPLETVVVETAQHSVELTQNAKGEFTFACKLYFEDNADTGAVDKCFALYRRFLELKDGFAVPAGKLTLAKKGD